MTVLQGQRLRAKQQAAWDEIVDDAEAYATSLCAPMALIRAADFLDFGHLVEFEVIREEGKLRFLDTLEKVYDFQKKFITVFLSHQWFSWNIPDPDGVHFKTMCAAVSRAAHIANVSLDNIFLWVDVCSIPQERCPVNLLGR